MRAAYAVELLKFRRSRVVQVTTVALLVLPCLLAAAFVAASGRGGTDPMSLKASAVLVGQGWPGYLSGLVQVFATGGLLGMGVVVGWSFAREFTDRTVASLYASATPRERVVTAKFGVLTAWATLLAIILCPVALLVGLVTGLGLPTGSDLSTLGRVAVLAVLTGLLAQAAGLFASLGRGPLPAVGGIVGLLVAAQVAVVAGVGGWFPWSLPALWAMADPASGLDPVSAWQLLLIPATTAIVVLATHSWWHRMEVT